VAQGGDIGAAVTDAMAIQAPDGLTGIHLNVLRRPPLKITAALLGRAPAPDMTEDERAAFEALGAQAQTDAYERSRAPSSTSSRWAA
jgi:hypothetical protein